MKKILSLLSCLFITLALAGCGAPKEISDVFTLEDMENHNVANAVFQNHASVRTKSVYYGFDMPGDSDESTQNAVFVKNGGGIKVYTDFSFGYAYAIENGKMYFEEDDGTYGMHAFFDDGYFEEYYLPSGSKWIAYVPTKGEEVVSRSIAKDVLTLVTEVRASNAEEFESLGIPDGIVECVYEMDAASGLIHRIHDYLTPDGGEKRLLSERDVIYGKDDGFIPPDYVLRCRDLTESRTITFIREPGEATEKGFDFTVAKGAKLIPLTMETWEYYDDPECTSVNELTDLPDGAVIYMRIR